MRRLVYPLTALLLLAGCGPAGRAGAAGDGAVGAAPSPAVSGAECPPEGVRLGAGVADAAMGLRVQDIELVNCGVADYAVSAYPEVRALGADRAVLDVDVLNGVTAIAGGLSHLGGPPQPLTLRPGERVHAVVAWRNTYDDVSRPAVLAPFLRVAPEPGRPAQVLEIGGGVDLGSTGRLGVSPWLRKATPEGGPENGRPAPATPVGPAPEPAPERPLL